MKYVSADQMNAIDHCAMNTYHIPRLCLMENAGRTIAQEVQIHVNSNPDSAEYVLICGPGFNGADGLVCARHLLCAGAKVSVILLGARLKQETTLQAKIIEKLGVNISVVQQISDLPALNSVIRKSSCVIDCIFGVGLCRAPQGIYYTVIEQVKLLICSCGECRCAFRVGCRYG